MNPSEPPRSRRRPELFQVDRSWWIGEGAERCPSCLQGYAVEVEMRCVACDERGCIHCIAIVRLEGADRIRLGEADRILCPACIAEAEREIRSGEEC